MRTRVILGAPESTLVPSDDEARFTIYRDADRLKPEDYPLQRALKTGKSVPTQPLCIRRADGVKMHIEGSVRPVINGEGKIMGCIGLFNDVIDLWTEFEGCATQQSTLVQLSLFALSENNVARC